MAKPPKKKKSANQVCAKENMLQRVMSHGPFLCSMPLIFSRI